MNLLANHIADHWESHIAAGAGTWTYIALTSIFNLQAICTGICVGVGVFIITSFIKLALKKLF